MSKKIEYLEELGLTDLVKVSNTNNGEYKGPCPECGGKDRFTVTPDHSKYPRGCFICRGCGFKGILPRLVEYLNGDITKLTDSVSVKPEIIISKEPPCLQWQQDLIKGLPLLCRNHRELCSYGYWRRGLSEKTVEELSLSAFYGKSKSPVTIGGSKILLSPGLYIPNYRGDVLWGVEVRLFNANTKYVSLKGSRKVPYHYTKLDRIEASVIIVESALDAALIYQEAGDLMHAVALGSASTRPDKYTKTLLSMATKIFVCLDYDEPGRAETRWWEKNYPQANIIFQPYGKDIGDFKIGSGCIRSWIEKLLSGGEIPQRPQPEIKAYMLETPEEVLNLVKEIKDRGYSPGISITKTYLAFGFKEQSYVWRKSIIPDEAKRILEDIRLITHDGVDSLLKLKDMGIHCKTVESTRLQFGVISSMDKDLENLSQFRIGYGTDFCKNKYEKALMEAHTVWVVYHEQDKKIQDKNLVKPYALFRDAQQAVAQIRTYGLYFDKELHKELYTKWQETVDDANTQLLSLYGPKFLRFYDEKTGRIYPHVKFDLNNTGRLSCSEPNLTSVPKNETRKLFKAPEGSVLIEADYSQIDLRIAALISQDETMLKVFEQGKDFHTIAAAAINEIPEEEVTAQQRQDAKSINFSLTYGGKPGNSEKIQGIFSGFFQWQAMQGSRNYAKTPTGRIIYRDPSDLEWQRKLYSYPIQSGSSEVMLAALARLTDFDVKIILTVHDSIILEAPEKDSEAVQDILKQAMVQGFLDIFPDAPTTNLVDIKTGKTWFNLL